MISTLKDTLFFASRPMLCRLTKFKNIHGGESCYIFGDGISIKFMDLTVFGDKPAIAVNYMPFHKDMPSMDCRYAVMAEPYYFCPWLGGNSLARIHHLNLITRLYRELVEATPHRDYFFNLSNFPFFRRQNVYHFFRDIPDCRLQDDFITKRIDCYAGVMRAAILIAIYLGFKQATLVGFDYSHSQSLSGHWYEKGKGKLQPMPGFSEEFFSIAKEFIDITSITLEGSSGVVDAITYKDYTGQNLCFKENTELASLPFLRALDTDPRLGRVL